MRRSTRHRGGSGCGTEGRHRRPVPTCRSGFSREHAFDYDHLGRYWRYKENGATVATCVHNAFGERQVRTVGSTVTHFLYDGPNLMHEKTGAAGRDYIYLEGTLVALVQNGQLYFVHTDHLGRPEVVTDGAQAVAWSSENNAFGNNPGSSTIGDLHVGFPGQYYDIESGLYYNYFRTYDATTGRYLQSDPIGLAGGLNVYVYVEGNPVGYIDPTGLQSSSGSTVFDYLSCKLVPANSTSPRCGQQFAKDMADDSRKAGAEVLTEGAERAEECAVCALKAATGIDVRAVDAGEVIESAAEDVGVEISKKVLKEAGEAAVESGASREVVERIIFRRAIPGVNAVFLAKDTFEFGKCILEESSD